MSCLMGLPLTPLGTTEVVFDPFDMFKSQFLVAKCVFKHQDLQMLGLKINKYD